MKMLASQWHDGLMVSVAMKGGNRRPAWAVPQTGAKGVQGDIMGFVAVSKDGRFAIEGLLPGEYEVVMCELGLSASGSCQVRSGQTTECELVAQEGTAARVRLRPAPESSVACKVELAPGGMSLSLTHKVTCKEEDGLSEPVPCWRGQNQWRVVISGTGAAPARGGGHVVTGEVTLDGATPGELVVDWDSK